MKKIMGIRKRLFRTLSVGALGVIITAISLAVWGMAPAAAQQGSDSPDPKSVAFGVVSLATAQAARLNVVNTSARDQAPLSMTLAFDIYTRSSSTSGDSTGDPDAGLDGYRFRRRVSQEVTVAPGESASFDYTNSAAESAQVRAVLEVAGIDTSPGGEVAGIDTSPVIVTFELHERGRPVTVVARKADPFAWMKCIQKNGTDPAWASYCHCIHATENRFEVCAADLLFQVRANSLY